MPKKSTGRSLSAYRALGGETQPFPRARSGGTEVAMPRWGSGEP